MSIDKNFYVNMDVSMDKIRGHLTYLSPFLESIVRRVTNKDLAMLEVGIGTGACCSFLEAIGYAHSFGIDIEPEIIYFYNQKVRPLLNSNVGVKVANAFNLFEVKKNIDMDIGCVYHQGLFEHFSEEDVNLLIKHHLEVTDLYFIFAVPIEGHVRDANEYDPEEVHHSLEWWLALTKNYKLYEYGVFGVDINKHQAYFVFSK